MTNGTTKQLTKTIMSNHTTAAQRRNNRMDEIFANAREHDKQIKKLPLEYAAGSIGNAQRGVVAMLKLGAWGYDDETGKLLASAPELLAALEGVLNTFEQDGWSAAKFMQVQRNTICKEARAAIAKARGN